MRHYLYFEATVALYILTVITFIFFFAGVFVTLAIWRRGKAKNLYHKVGTAAMVKAFILNVILQLQIIKFSFIRWFMHFCIFMGFIGLLALTAWEAFLADIMPANSALVRVFFNNGGKLILDVWGEVFGTMLLAGIVIAVLRRYVFKVAQLDTILKDTTSIVLLLIITLSGFIAEAFRLMAAAGSPDLAYSFVGLAFAKILEAVGIPVMNYKVFVWIHGLVAMFFIALIPFSKMWHAFASPIEVLLDASEKAGKHEADAQSAQCSVSCS
ncbi:MAG: respiratory nitrate reductase subunit gamma [Proteobacteria bacterium]|nr:respiratory nitrate reductase subunit gamma [Pseudomonadota bacterium]